VGEAELEQLAARIRDQGWDQGCALDVRDRLFLAERSQPITREAHAARRADDGTGPFVVHAEVAPDDQYGAVIATQLCDIVAFPPTDPLIEALPVIELPDGRQLPHPNSARQFLLDPDRRLVADARFRVSFEKALLPDRPAEQLIANEQRLRSFRAWCARRYSRHPFPDDFVETVGAALEHAWKAPTRRRSDAAQAMHVWRVVTRGEDGTDVLLLVPFDEKRATKAEIDALLDEVMSLAAKRLPKAVNDARSKAYGRGLDPDTVRSFNVRAVSIPSANLSLKVMRDAPPLNLEHLTYHGDGVWGVEPHIELDD
jgi:hypothetical protein